MVKHRCKWDNSYTLVEYTSEYVDIDTSSDYIFGMMAKVFLLIVIICIVMDDEL